MTADIIAWTQPKPLSDDPTSKEDDKATVANLVSAVENIDTGMKLMIDTLVDMEKRLRKLELGERKKDRKLAILNQNGERVN